MKEAILYITAILAVIAGLTWLMVRSDRSQLEGCEQPEFLQAVPHVNGSYSGGSGSTTTSITYIYRCKDGHVIELFGRLSK